MRLSSEKGKHNPAFLVYPLKLGLFWLKLALNWLCCLNNQMSHLHVFSCQKRTYVNFGRLDFGFVLNKKLINSYEFFRRDYLVMRIA